MSTVLVSFKTDDKTKRDMKKFATELGMPMTTLVNVLIRQALRDRKVTLGPGLKPTPYLQKLIKEAEVDYKADKNISPSFDSVDAMFDHLKKTA